MIGRSRAGSLSMGLLYLVFFRVSRVLIVVFGLVVVVFILTRTLTDPVDIILGPNSSLEQRTRINSELGFDRPLWEQFGSYIGDLLHGDFGRSLSLDRPAIDAIMERLPASLLLAVASISIAAVVGLSLGISGGLRPGSILDRLTVGISSMSVAVPDFWLALSFISIFSVQLGWFPTGGYRGLDDLRYLVMPATTLALLPTGRLAKVVRESVIEEMAKDYIVAARSRGMRTFTIMRRHVIKNIAISTTTVIGFDFLLLFSGFGASLEVVFGWPGIGRLAIQATLVSDVVLVSAIVVVTGLIVGIGNLLLDLFHAVIDKRITT
jgi:ABC-type dipeptide/oligopeptide/nickel transport system permease component